MQVKEEFVLPAFYQCVLAAGALVLCSTAGYAEEPSALVASVAEPTDLSGFIAAPHVEGLARQLALSSDSILVLDPATREVLLTKAAREVRPIASITKLMTALLVVESELPLDEVLQVTQADADTIKHTHSRLQVGARLTRRELLHLALMSSENRAAHALGRNTPGGIPAFVRLMNLRAAVLGMSSTRFKDPTGLSEENQSNAEDLARLVLESSRHEVIRTLSTDAEEKVELGPYTLIYRTSNRLVRNSRWDIDLQKTGYIREAGRCLVMQVSMAGRKVIMVLLHATSPARRLRDVERLRRWLEGGTAEVAGRVTQGGRRAGKAKGRLPETLISNS